MWKPEKMELQIIAALVSLVSVVIAVGVMWGWLKRTVDEHTEALRRIMDTEFLTTQTYELHNQKTMLEIEHLTQSVQQMRVDMDKDRETLRTFQLGNASAMARIERETMLRNFTRKQDPERS